jgi:hypothetical protein
MNTKSTSKKISTYKSIENLGLSERERSRALENLAIADTLVGAFIAASKLLQRH